MKHVIAALGAALLLSGCGLPSIDVPRSLPAPQPGPAPSPGGIPDYERRYFGTPWVDTDRNGCDTRNDVLQRDLTNVVFDEDDPGCTVNSGILEDPYTGKIINFTRGTTTSREVQIEHIVPLREAWYSGAWRWIPAQRIGFANDPGNLLAIDGDLNAAKGARDPAQWRPPSQDAWCAYALSWEDTKRTYGLGMDGAERRALVKMKENC